MPNSCKQKQYFISLTILAGMFFIFGFVSWVNSILIPYFRIACELTHFESYFVAFAFYIAYFVMAIPSGILPVSYTHLGQIWEKENTNRTILGRSRYSSFSTLHGNLTERLYSNAIPSNCKTQCQLLCQSNIPCLGLLPSRSLVLGTPCTTR